MGTAFSAGWMRRVLQAGPGVCFARRRLVVSGTVWTARLHGSPPMAAQAGTGPLPAGERQRRWIAAPYGCLAKGLWKNGRVGSPAGKSRRLARDGTNLASSPHLV
jgi:hypothetical protein